MPGSATPGYLPQRLVRALLVVLPAPLVEAYLLRLPVRLRRTSRRRLEGAVHALVPPILVRPSWINAFVLNPQLDPPHPQTGEPVAEPVGRHEGDSVVAAEHLGQPPLPEERLQRGAHACARGLVQPGNCTHVPRTHVLHRQRIAELRVARTELAPGCRKHQAGVARCQDGDQLLPAPRPGAHAAPPGAAPPPPGGCGAGSAAARGCGPPNPQRPPPCSARPTCTPSCD